MPLDRTVSISKKMLATVWLLSNIESYRGVADRFGFNKGALRNIASSVCNVLMTIRQEVIIWPRTQAELAALEQGWMAKGDIPGVIAAIDGTYIKIPGPCNEKRDSYICRKGFPAVHLQV